VLGEAAADADADAAAGFVPHPAVSRRITQPPHAQRIWPDKRTSTPQRRSNLASTTLSSTGSGKAGAAQGRRGDGHFHLPWFGRSLGLLNSGNAEQLRRRD
jgi:hypothetical protein